MGEEMQGQGKETAPFKGNVIPDQICNSPLDSVISHPREITRYRACPKREITGCNAHSKQTIFLG
jgi:hypothetical protein